MKMPKEGLIHIYCGDGKGKTTAAIGLSIRALGRDYQVIFLQFLKWQETGEISAFKAFNNLTVIRGENLVHKFTWNMTETEKNELIQTHNEMFRHAESMCTSDKCLLVMDELIGTYDMNLIDREMVLTYLQHKPKNLEIVMTGRNPAEELLEIADYVSEIKKVKHPMDQGIVAREGIEM